MSAVMADSKIFRALAAGARLAVHPRADRPDHGWCFCSSSCQRSNIAEPKYHLYGPRYRTDRPRKLPPDPGFRSEFPIEQRGAIDTRSLVRKRA